MKTLRAIGWTLALFATVPLWVVLAALEIIARPVRWLSRGCAAIVAPIVAAWVTSVRALRTKGQSESEMVRRNRRFFARAARARKGWR